MIKEFKDVNLRISTLTLKDKNLHIVLINVHAPTEDKDEEKKKNSMIHQRRYLILRWEI
jgi:hypothetical protein